MVKEKCRASGLWDSKWLSSAVDGIPFGKATPYLVLSLSLPLISNPFARMCINLLRDKLNVGANVLPIKRDCCFNKWKLICLFFFWEWGGVSCGMWQHLRVVCVAGVAFADLVYGKTFP